MTELSTVAERVARGAELLDRREPGWAKRIVWEDLDMGNCRWCVLGQVYGSYGDGLARFPDRIDEAEYGFDISPRSAIFKTRDQEYIDLAVAWRAAIAERVAVPEEVAP